MDIRVSLWGMCVCVFNSVNTVNWLIVSPWGDYVSYTYWIRSHTYICPVFTIFVCLRVFFGLSNKRAEES